MNIPGMRILLKPELYPTPNTSSYGQNCMSDSVVVVLCLIYGDLVVCVQQSLYT